MPSFSATRRVEFHQTDAAGIMHFAEFFPLMESVEHEFLRSLGLSVMSRDENGVVSWPRVNAQCDYKSAAKFDDLLAITLSIARLGEKSVTYTFDIQRDNEPIAAGTVTAVCCRMTPEGPQSMPIPQAIREKLEPFCD